MQSQVFSPDQGPHSQLAELLRHIPIYVFVDLRDTAQSYYGISYNIAKILL